MEFKRTGKSLFESSLEIKCLFFFGVALAIVILISVSLYYKATKSQVEAQNTLMGKLISEREFLLIHIKGLAIQGGTGSVAAVESVGARDDSNDFIDSMTSLSEEIGNVSTRSRFETRLIRAFRNRGDNSDDAPRDDYELKLLEDLDAQPFDPAETSVSSWTTTDATTITSLYALSGHVGTVTAA